MFPLVWSGCGQDTVMLLEARLTWCTAGTAEGTGVGGLVAASRVGRAGERSKEVTGSLGESKAHLCGWC